MNSLKVEEFKKLIGLSVREAKLWITSPYYIRDMTGFSICGADANPYRINVKTDKEGNIRTYDIG